MTVFQDARSFTDEETVLNPAICIIGAGASGIALALSLSRRKIPVMLIESGSAAMDGVTQRLYAGGNTGVRYYDLTSCRLRYFGGTTNHWSGYCRDNDPVDYLPRPEVGLPGWPVSHEEVIPFIAQAAKLLEIDSDFFDPAQQLKARDIDADELIDGKTKRLETKNFQIAKNIRFGPRFRDELAQSPYVTPIENLNVVELRLNDAGTRVDHLLAKTTNGKNVRINPQNVVLCCHGIENARMLLNSDGQNPKGIGNDFDHVGRYFMEHPHVFASRMIPTDLFPQLYDRVFLSKKRMNANLSISQDTLRSEGILNYYCRFNPVFVEKDVASALGRLPRRMMQPASRQLFTDVGHVLSDLPGVVQMKANRFFDVKPRYYELEHRIEQAPNPNSRITLTDQRNILGQREINLNWEFNDLDLKTFNVGQDILVKELSALQMGRFEVETITMQMLRDHAQGHYHHIGTTRMSARKEDGVVDANAKVHGIENLHIGGSSIFPSAGYSGPTMVLIGFALRLADHLAALHKSTGG